MNEFQLKYGTNPNQKPARIYMADGSDLPVQILNGRPGYINFLDAFNSWQLVRDLKKALGQPAAASFKHVSPAGAAIGLPLDETLRAMYHIAPETELSPLACAYARARGADRMSSFGDWIALSDVCDLSTAKLIQHEVSDGIIAPGYDADALEVLKSKKKGNYAIVQIDAAYEPKPLETRTVFGVTFEQGRQDLDISDATMLQNIVTENQFISEERQFAAPSDGDTIAIFSTSLGEVRAVLYPDAAPMAVYNFVGLARSGYYDGTIIWRSQYGFAVQGGDATGTGTGGSTIWSNPPYPLEADASLKHYTGALCAAFAQGGDVTGGNSQFYFVAALPDSVSSDQQAELAQNGYTDSQVAAYAAVGGLPYLDNTDTVFGQVYQGMDVVDAMACVETTKDEDGNDTWKPTEDAAITIEKVTITTYPGPAAGDEATSDSSVG